MKKLIASYLLAVLILVFGPAALKAGPLCPRQNATLVGTYMSHGTGSVKDVGPVAAVGTITYDGQGHLVNPFTLSVNGTVSTLNQTGTYTVNRDCTGTVVQAGAHYNFVVSPDASTVFWIETDAGTTINGTAVRLNPVEDADAKVQSNDKLIVPASHRAGTLQPTSLRRIRQASANPKAKTAAANRQLSHSS